MNDNKKRLFVQKRPKYGPKLGWLNHFIRILRCLLSFILGVMEFDEEKHYICQNR